jgi:nitric oxide dioxygenase
MPTTTVTITDEQVELVQSSFAAAAPRADELTSIFYRRLFELAPGVRPLFPTDIDEQRVKLARELAAIVAAITDPAALVTRMEALGARHIRYGAVPEHYPVVGEALLGTLGEMFGAAFTDELATAWALAYGMVADAMIAGACSTSAS